MPRTTARRGLQRRVQRVLFCSDALVESAEQGAAAGQVYTRPVNIDASSGGLFPVLENSVLDLGDRFIKRMSNLAVGYLDLFGNPSSGRYH